MTEREMTVLKMNILGGMDTLVRQYADEDTFDYWLAEGVPDGADEETLEELAEYDETFKNISKAFARALEMCQENCGAIF